MHAHGLEVRIVLQPSAAGDTPARVRAALVAALAEAGAVPPAVEVIPVAASGREGDHAAERKLVKKLV